MAKRMSACGGGFANWFAVLALSFFRRVNAEFILEEFLYTTYQARGESVKSTLGPAACAH